MSQNDDGSAFLHSNELRASWVHLRESLLDGPSVASAFCIYGKLIRARRCTQQAGVCSEAEGDRDRVEKADGMSSFHSKNRVYVLNTCQKSCDDALKSKRSTQKTDNSQIYQCRQRYSHWSHEAQVCNKLYTEEVSSSTDWFTVCPGPIRDSCYY